MGEKGREIDFGAYWQLEPTVDWPRWRITWFEETGDLFAINSRVDKGEERVLIGEFNSEHEVRRFMGDWGERWKQGCTIEDLHKQWQEQKPLPEQLPEGIWNLDEARRELQRRKEQRDRLDEEIAATEAMIDVIETVLGGGHDPRFCATCVDRPRGSKFCQEDVDEAGRCTGHSH